MTDRPTDELCRLLIESLPDGAVLSDATTPELHVLYANRAFERLTGHAAAQLVGQSLPLFDAGRGDSNGLHRVLDAMRAGLESRAVIRCLHRDGSPLLLDVHVAPVRDESGRITHWASMFRAAATRAMADPAEAARDAWPAPQRLGRRDPLTGLPSRAGFEALLHDSAAQPAGQGGPAIAMFLVDVDDLAGYNSTFGRAAGDAMLKRVGAALGAAFRRSSDVLARWDGGTFAAATMGMEPGRVQDHAESLRTRVRDLCIHHPHSRFGKFVSVSVAVAVAPGGDGDALNEALQQALEALDASKAAALQPTLMTSRSAQG